MITLQLLRQEIGFLTKNWNWQILGFVDQNSNIHPIDSDSKVISTIFERLAYPVLQTIADKYSYNLELANQNTYPDFTFTKNETPHRFALDIKTTHLGSSKSFTLGGYNSFIRNNTKGIIYPYDTYHQHYIWGFLYSRGKRQGKYDLNNLPNITNIELPYKGVNHFIQHKHLISSLIAGSGNTKNIGSIYFKLEEPLENQTGPFSKIKDGKKAFDFYWKNFEGYKDIIKTEIDLLRHPDFQQFL